MFDIYKGLWTALFGPNSESAPTAMRALVINDDGSINVVSAIGPPVGVAILEAAINFSASGDNTIIAAGGVGKVIRVYRIYFTVASATTIQFKGTALTDAPLNFAADGALVFDLASDPWFTGSSNTAFVMNSSIAVQVSGRVYYTVT